MQLIAEALPGLAESARTTSLVNLHAGYSRDDGEDEQGGADATTAMNCTSGKSGRPGSNWHHQLGRLRFYH